MVDLGKEHIKLFIGPFGEKAQVIALLAPAGERSFTVQFVVAKADYAEALNEVTRALNFYLIEKGENHPWAYAKYHCSTASNIYSPVHWGLYRSAT
ncbi:MAG: hypothetical protein ABIU05_04810 [Nitrospirales bacterium]